MAIDIIARAMAVKHETPPGLGDLEELTTINKSNAVAAINEVNSIAKGAHQTVTYDDYETTVASINILPDNYYNIGQNIMVITLDVPDLWISEIFETSVPYTYISDESFVDTLNSQGYVQVGYYALSALETQKIDLVDYVQFTDVATTTTNGAMSSTDKNKLDNITTEQWTFTLSSGETITKNIKVSV